MKKVIKNNYKFILGMILGLVVSVSSVYAVEAYIESNKVSYDNHSEKVTKKDNVQESIDELYERSGIHKEKWIDKTLNGADPVLKDPLIPVEIKSNGDVYYANLNSEWYNYSEKRWANAVILTDTAKEYSIGQQIEEDDIESYFVWIPRYKYKVWDLGNYNKVFSSAELTDAKETSTEENFFWNIIGNKASLINIEFGDSNHVKVETGTKQGSGESGGDQGVAIGNYLIHPAFKLGNKELNGIWVGKFETGYKGATSKATAQKNEEASDKIIIKPDVYSWRGNTIKKAFMSAYNYKSTSSNNHNTILDPHMMKNTEWGAVAYLSHSEYGIGTEIRINNTSDCKTGYSATSEAKQIECPGETTASSDKTKTQPWNSATGYLASTTGNISGVYDMSGGGWETVAACMEGILGNSDFTLEELTRYMNSGYIDKYSNASTMSSFNKRILGDATGELGPFLKYYHRNGGYYWHSSWYADDPVFVGSSYPWFIRGGGSNEGSLAGQFYFNWSKGDYVGYFRLVLAITK